MNGRKSPPLFWLSKVNLFHINNTVITPVDINGALFFSFTK